MTDILQLLAANLEEADPTIFGILQKVSIVLYLFFGATQKEWSLKLNRRKYGRNILSTSSRQRTSLPRQYSMLWAV